MFNKCKAKVNEKIEKVKQKIHNVDRKIMQDDMWKIYAD